MEGVRVEQEEARRLSAEIGDRALEGWERLFQGLAATLEGSIEAGREALTDARDLHHELAVRNGEGKAIAALGLIEMMTGEPGRAKELVEGRCRCRSPPGTCGPRASATPIWG